MRARVLAAAFVAARKLWSQARVRNISRDSASAAEEGDLPLPERRESGRRGGGADGRADGAEIATIGRSRARLEFTSRARARETIAGFA